MSLENRLNISQWAATGFWALPNDSALSGQEHKSEVLVESKQIETSEDNLEGSCEVDELDLSFEDENYVSIIMPAVVNVDSDCETDILDKIISAEAENLNKRCQNVEVSTNIGSKNNSLVGSSSDVSDVASTTTILSNSADCENSPNYKKSRIVSKNENFESSLNSSDAHSQILPVIKRKIPYKLDYDSSDSVDTMIYIKSNQKVKGVKSGYKKRLAIPYKPNDSTEKKAEQIVTDLNPEKLNNENIKLSSISQNETMGNGSIDDCNKSTTDSKCSEKGSYATIVMPAQVAIGGNSDLDSFFNKDFDSESSEDVLDQSFDDSHYRTIVMPATEKVDSECETDILEVDFSAQRATVERFTTNSDDNTADGSNENSKEDDDEEDIITFYAIPYDPSVPYENYVDDPSSVKTMDEFFEDLAKILQVER